MPGFADNEYVTADGVLHGRGSYVIRAVTASPTSKACQAKSFDLCSRTSTAPILDAVINMKDIALEILEKHAHEGAVLRELFFSSQGERLREAALRAAACLAAGGKILLCGNGAGAACAQHIAAEFVNRFLMDRPALPAIAIAADATVLTSVGNELDFSQIFSRQVEALGRTGDMLVVISSSENCANIAAALDAARRSGMLTVGIAAFENEISHDCDIVVETPEASAALCHELHAAAGHMLCRLTDYYLFENTVALTPYL